MLKEFIPADASIEARNIYKLACGASAGVVSQSVSYPIDTIRRRMQLQGCDGGKRLYKNTMDCGMQVISREGPLGLFRGILANLLRAAPNTAIQFWLYDTCCILLEMKSS